MAHRGIAQRGLICALTLASLTACGTIDGWLEPTQIDYKSSGKAPRPRLEIPPDLTQLQRDNRYTISENARGTVTASNFTTQQGATTSAAVAPVLPVSAQMRIERAGNTRWLVVKQVPEALWPQIKDFWQDSGFLINIEARDAGIMETDWAENRAKIPRDFIRNTIGKMIDSIYSTGERDKFRTRVERAPDGSTEIFISHRGASEVFNGVAGGKDSTVWSPRPADPELEAEFLARLMARLGTDDVRAKATVANAVAAPNRSKLSNDASGAFVEVDEGFDRAWRRVGLALDRVGFTVEDRDRNQGLYFVRYVDQDKDAQNKAERSFFSRLLSFGSSDDKAKEAQRYRVSVKGSGAGSRVAVLDNAGKPETSQIAGKILALLNEQLK